MTTWRTQIQRELNRGLRDVVGDKTAKAFVSLGVHTVGDLVRHVPRRYIAGTGMSDFSSLRVGDDVAVVAKVVETNLVAGRALRVETMLTDGTGHLRATFFARKQYHAEYWHRMLRPGDRGIFVGKVGVFRDQLQLAHPEFVMLDSGNRITGRGSEVRQQMERVVQRGTMVGLYPASSKLRTWTIADTVSLVLPTVIALGDTLPDWVIEAAGVMPLDVAVREVHEPYDLDGAQRGIQRLRFDEAFGLQLAMGHRRRTVEGQEAVPRKRRDDGLLAAFDARLPFTLTNGQQSVGEQIFTELGAARPMHRLLQGEVGSGKTLVALRAMLAVVDAGGQAVLLAPTEVLAKQHHTTIAALLGDLGTGQQLDSHPEATELALLTGSGRAAARRDSLDAIADGRAGIVIGTHALLSDPVSFHDLGLVVIDEQHRFGVEQRSALAGKATHQPHTLVMTATPIPRSVAMTVFGDLEVSELRELPAGRQPIQTVLVNTADQPAWVARAWERVREEVGKGRQAFIVCPAITPKQAEADVEGAPGVTAVTDLLPELEQGPLQGLRLGMVHGRQPATERDQVMQAFAAGDVDVLVATTVIEVGVNVPNATVMVVMDADRFGLAQLHQLRGRVGRGEHPGLCLLLAAPDPENLVAGERLQALVDSSDGFDLAERDLELRREGDVLGAAQSGGSSLKLLRVLRDAPLIERAKDLADQVLDDPRAADDPHLADLITQAELLAAGEWLERS